MTKVKRNVLLSPRRFTAIDDTRLAFLRLSANRDFHEAFRKFPQDNRATDLRRETHRRRSSRGISARKFQRGIRSWRKRKRDKKKEHFVGRVVGRTPLLHVDARKSEEKREVSRNEKRALALEFPTGARVCARARNFLERGCSFTGPCARRTPFLLGEKKACQVSSRRCIRDGFP